MVHILPGHHTTPQIRCHQLTRQSPFAVECEEALRDQAELASLFRACFSPFRYKELGRDRKNASAFFHTGMYNVGLIGFADTPVMYARPGGS
jgi:hypothetical protein